MKNVQSILATVLALVMVLSLAACGGNAPEETEARETTVVTEAATEETAPIPTETEDEEEENEDIFTDSVSQKGAPAVSGKIIIRKQLEEDKIDLEKDEVVCEVPAEKLLMVPFAKREGTEVQEGLEAAYTEILKAETLADLDEDMTEAAEETGVDLEKLVVRDLVDIALDPEYQAVLDEDNKYTQLTFGLDLKEGLIVMTRDAEGEWTVISGDAITYNEDGSVTVIFEDLCPVAFVVEG